MKRQIQHKNTFQVKKSDARGVSNHSSVRLCAWLWNEEGFSTVGVALALLISVALIFSAARVYEVQSSAADIQNVADACACSAENVVAEFYIVSNICDAVVLSLSLSSLMLDGIAVVAMCIPPAHSVGSKLLQYAQKIAEARDTFSKNAKEGLSVFQEALPVIAAAQAISVMSGNSGGTQGAHYLGVALLTPLQGEDISDVTFEKSDTAQSDIGSATSSLQDLSSKAEEAAERANQYKEQAYQHDSGSETAYCMYERAKTLAHLSGAENPFYSSSETWDFSVALERAQTYYASRLANEKPASAAVSEGANSALRKRFFEYACTEVNKGYVHETEKHFSANFPLLPKNTSEMKETKLYTDRVYPISSAAEEGKKTMHAWSGCPQLQQSGTVALGSIKDMDTSDDYVTCTSCGFSASSMGKVAAASSSIDNGFEYHYRVVATAAQEYQKARSELAPLMQELENTSNNLFGELLSAFQEASNARIQVQPPGRFGVVAVVADTSAQSSVGHFSSSFVEDAGMLGTRCALSSAVLVKDESSESKTVINSVLDGFTGEAAGATGAAQIALDVWSGMLKAYEQGEKAVVNGVESALDSLPLASHSGIGVLVAKSLQATLSSIGLAPAKLSSPKAVVCNSTHVLAKGDNAFTNQMSQAKARVLATGADDATLFSVALTQAEQSALSSVDSSLSNIEIASVELFDGAVTIPVTIALPGFITEGIQAQISTAFDSLQSMAGSFVTSRRWE